MIPIDLDRARAAHSALNEFFAAHPKGRLDRVAEDESYTALSGGRAA
jgi:hypothetical protein